MTDAQRQAAERGFADRLEGRTKNPYLDQAMATVWQEGHEAGGRLMRGRDRMDSFDQVDKWKTPGFDGRATVEHAKAVTQKLDQAEAHLQRLDTAVSVLANSLPVVRMSGPEYDRFVAGANERHQEFEAGYKAWRDQSYTRGEHGHWQDRAGNSYTGERLREDYSKILGGLTTDAPERAVTRLSGPEYEALNTSSRNVDPNWDRDHAFHKKHGHWPDGTEDRPQINWTGQTRDPGLGVAEKWHAEHAPFRDPSDGTSQVARLSESEYERFDAELDQYEQSRQMAEEARGAGEKRGADPERGR